MWTFFIKQDDSVLPKYPKAVQENLQKKIIKTDWRKSFLQIQIKYLLFLKHYNFSEAWQEEGKK